MAPRAAVRGGGGTGVSSARAWSLGGQTTRSNQSLPLASAPPRHYDLRWSSKRSLCTGVQAHIGYVGGNGLHVAASAAPVTVHHCGRFNLQQAVVVAETHHGGHRKLQHLRRWGSSRCRPSSGMKYQSRNARPAVFVQEVAQGLGHLASLPRWARAVVRALKRTKSASMPQNRGLARLRFGRTGCPGWCRSTPAAGRRRGWACTKTTCRTWRWVRPIPAAAQSTLGCALVEHQKPGVTRV